MVAIATRALTKVFSDDVVAIDNLDLDVPSGEFMVLLGPTGCGKSTLLRIIAGIEEPTSGEVLLDGVGVNGMSAQERNVAMVFQAYALYPHLTVAQNIGFPLRAGREDHGDVAARIAEAARHLGIQDLLNRFPAHLSGGQRQRVAMARAVVRRPSLLLLDEPMSNVDAGVRAELRGEVVDLAHRLGVTTVYVTHDQSEAMSMADRVAVLRRGVLQQVGPPAEVYADPQTVFVAAFLGTPRTNLLEGAVYVDGDRALLDLGSQVLELPAGDPRRAALARHHTERVTVALRADALTPVADDAPGVLLRGTVRLVENLGHEVLVHLDTGGVRTSTEASRMELPDGQQSLAGMLGEEQPTGGGALRQTLSRLVPRQRQPEQLPATARTSYGFYPVYDPELPGDPPPAGEVVARIPAPARPARGDAMTFAVDLDRMLLFDRAGDRIRLE
jgi:multiple sugar transport system ATP-binding protein